MQADELAAVAITAIEELKGLDIATVDVSKQTSITDKLIIASATSSRQLAALANHVYEKLKATGAAPHNPEGSHDSGWILVDGGDVIVHLMLPETRDYYNIEKLWQEGLPKSRITAPEVNL
ncbi:MAG: ribosome silencing factor [Gammaproteobacteria bacterium]|nr:ribosome silencing factor [Gammaproteobacteria bacterium]